MRRRSPARLTVPIVTALAALAAVPAHAAPPRRDLPTPQELAQVRPDPEILSLVEALGGEDYGVREAAMETILTLEPSLNVLLAILADESLPAEARYRLLEVLRERVMSVPRGAIGIEVDRRFGMDEVVVSRVLPSLPAARVLRPGDRLTHLDGEPITTWQGFVEMIQTHLPGEEIELVVQRPRRRTDDAAAPEAAPAPGQAPAPELDVLRFTIALGSADGLRDSDGRPQIGNALLQQRSLLVKQAAYRYGVQARYYALAETE